MTQLNPKELTPHPSIVHFPRPAAESEQWRGLMEDVREYGIRHPIQVTSTHQVVDGETRRLVALALGMEQVPVEVVPDDQVASVVLRELALRRNLTKSQIAYLAYPSIKTDYARSLIRRRVHLVPGGKTSQNPNVSSSVDSIDSRGLHGSALPPKLEELAAGLGVCRDLLIRAARIWEVFENDSEVEFQDGSVMTLRAYFEPRILDSDNPMSLSNAIKGIGYFRPMDSALGADAREGGETPRRASEYNLFRRTFDDLKSRMRYWEGFSREEREALQEELTEQLRGTPAEFRARLMTACKNASKE